MNRIASIMAMATVTAASEPLLASLVSYWKLNEASGTRNDSHGTNHLTDNNTVTSATGIISIAAVCTAANSEYLSCASNSTLQMSGNTDFTISCWIKLTRNDINQSLVTKDDDAANSRDFTLDYTVSGTPGLRFYIKGGATYLVATNAGTTGIWYFVVAWYDSSNGQLHIRINDTTTWDSASTGATGTDASSAQFRIGAREYAANEDYADASFDEVGLWKRVLTSGEITRLYNSGMGLTYPFDGSGGPDLLNGLRVYYALSNTSDASGGGLTLTNNNSATFGTGKVGNAATFVSASSQWLSYAENATFQMSGSTDFTMAAWVKFTSVTGARVAVYGYVNENGYGLGIGTDEIIAKVYDGTNTAQVNTGTTYNDGNWHLAIMTASRAGNLTLYIDNVQKGTPASMAGMGAMDSPSDYGFSIGAEVLGGSAKLDGSVDEVGIWARVLDGAERAALWNGGSGITYPF